jgi:hypothetical protein
LIKTAGELILKLGWTLCYVAKGRIDTRSIPTKTKIIMLSSSPCRQMKITFDCQAYRVVVKPMILRSELNYPNWVQSIERLLCT